MSNLDVKHRFRAHSFCTFRPVRLMEKVRRVLYEDSTSTPNSPRLTGIPPHITLLSQINSLKLSVEESTSRLEAVMKDELNRRGVGGEVFHANSILESVKEVHEKIIETLGGSGVGGGGGTGRVGDGGTEVVEDEGVLRQYYYYKGKYHNVPEGFVLPTMNLHTFILYWFVGSSHPFVPPLKNVSSYDFPKVKNMKCKLSMMRRMIKDGVVCRANKVGFDIGGEHGRNIKTAADATRLFNSIRHLFDFSGDNHERRTSQLCWKTVRDLFQKRGYKFVDEPLDNNRRRR